MARAQTIQIFLPNGDPRGIRIAELTTRIMQVIEVPRANLSEFLKTPEATQVAVYFLVAAPGADEVDPKLYVGQTSDLKMRLPNHNATKEFWERALVLISRTQSLTQTHALFLEWMSIQEARKAGRYILQNGNAGSRPYTPAPMEADCHEIHETAATLLATLGHPLFEPALRPASIEQGDTPELLFCKSSGADGRGYYNEEGLVVLKDSRGRLESVPSMRDSSDQSFRQRLIDSGVMRAEGQHVVFTRNHPFNSPSMAAVALLGRTANGWLEWKDSKGQTLHQLKRAVVETESASTVS